jgi:hypothetical protein
MIDKLRKHLDSLDRINRAKACTVLEWELSELEHIFGLLSAGIFVGIPSPPIQITFDLLPDMEREIIQLINKAETARGPLSDLFSILDVS